jgi:hypothetical protein
MLREGFEAVGLKSLTIVGCSVGLKSLTIVGCSVGLAQQAQARPMLPLASSKSCSGRVLGLLLPGPFGPSIMGCPRPRGTFGPLKAHQPLTADVMLTSAPILIKPLFYFQMIFRNDL